MKRSPLSAIIVGFAFAIFPWGGVISFEFVPARPHIRGSRYPVRVLKGFHEIPDQAPDRVSGARQCGIPLLFRSYFNGWGSGASLPPSVRPTVMPALVLVVSQRGDLEGLPRRMA